MPNDLIQLAKPIPPGISITPDGAYQWTGECSVFRCSPFAKIVHIVAAVFAALLCILIFSIEGGGSDAVLYCLIVVVGMAVLDGLICLMYAAKRAFRFKAVFTLGRDSVSAVETEADGQNVFVMILQLIAGLISQGDTSYGFIAEYSKIQELIPKPDKSMIRVKAGMSGGFLLTSPEQHDFILSEIQVRMSASRKTP